MKTSKKDFEYFKKRCEHWIEFWGVKDWEVCFFFEYFEEGGRAKCKHNPHAGVASIFLNTYAYDKQTKKDLDRSAFHEVMHIVLSDFFHLACERGTTEQMLDKVEERFIVRCENCVYKRLK